MKKETLATLEIGSIGYIKKIEQTGSIRRRLLDIGLIRGTKVKCLLGSPSLDPRAYLIRGAVIAIRQKDAAQIEIEGVTCQK